LIIDKEGQVAKHTSSRNTGVVHRPFYINPEKKAIFAKAAQKSYYLWSKLASQYNLPWKQSGTIEVALEEKDLGTLEQYRHWALQNGMNDSEVEVLDSQEVKRAEPLVNCAGAIYSKTDTSVDYGIFSKFVFEIASKNKEVNLLKGDIRKIEETEDGLELFLSDGSIKCDFLINAAGGGALDIAHMLDVGKEYTDLHFRGEYWRVQEPFASKISHNVYSVAKFKEFPFLDPHFIVRANGVREIGPNAVLVSGPEAYMGLSKSKSELIKKILERPLMPKFRLFTSKTFLSLAWSEWRSSVSKKQMCERVRKFIPSLDVEMLNERGLAGVRSSLISNKGFVPEAIMLDGKSSLHILNYNSPGATGAPAFSAYVVKTLEKKGCIKASNDQNGNSLWNYSDALSIF
jgi:L-2-hydroxyglutarate oxidase